MPLNYSTGFWGTQFAEDQSCRTSLFHCYGNLLCHLDYHNSLTNDWGIA